MGCFCYLKIGAFSCLVLLTACSKASPDAVKLQVDYNWTNANVCSNFSPEIKVLGIPPTTKQLRVTLTDLDFLIYDHGGGTVKYEGSNIIAAGALKDYRGPCPPFDTTHRYSIRVDAIDASGVIIGFGEKTKPCCQ
jgi:phosphatidylethanolamine-binding protein (PEBP) family uncharacterized protein